MSEWTRERVLELAPDDRARKAGQTQSGAKKWSLLARSDRALWGEIYGSGKKPYQTRVDLQGPAFKCSCPSRKFPCKHGLGLLITFADDPGSFPTASVPDWVNDWLEGRDGRAAKAAKRKAQGDKPADPKAKARREAAREKKVARGIEDLETWLEDLVRRGLVAVRSESSKRFDDMAKRLVDAQAPGLSRRVRQLGASLFEGPDWGAAALRAIGSLELLTSGYRNVASLSDELRAELRTAIGWTTKETELAKQPGVTDVWRVVGCRCEELDRVTAQRTWLWGTASKQYAVLLDFAAGNAPLDVSYVVGSQFTGELVYYPSALPLRAVFRTNEPAPGDGALPESQSIAGALASYAEALARVPWVDRWPLCVEGVVPSRSEERWDLSDGELSLRVDAGALDPWTLLAASGGAPLRVFGEWNGVSFLPLAFQGGDGVFATPRLGTGFMAVAVG